MKFSDGSHCHWTYRIGPFRSFWCFLSRQAVLDHLGGEVADDIFQVHGEFCVCEDKEQR